MFSGMFSQTFGDVVQSMGGGVIVSDIFYLTRVVLDMVAWLTPHHNQFLYKWNYFLRAELSCHKSGGGGITQPSHIRAI